jgi:6-phosphogluconolactonase
VAGDPTVNLIEYPDREMMMIDVANVLAGELNSCLQRHDFASFSVPGGSTPGPMFQSLCAADLDWSRVHVMLNDERWVAEDDPRSNTRLLKETLLVDRAAAAQFVPFYRPGETPEDAAEALSEALATKLPLSVLLLGMGSDMHTASLFPGAEGLAAAMAPDAAPVRAIVQPGTGEARVTLTAPVLADAMSKHILITGADKRDALERAAHLDAMEAPVRQVWKGATVHWAE